jgi:hypothetical protein
MCFFDKRKPSSVASGSPPVTRALCALTIASG